MNKIYEKKTRWTVSYYSKQYESMRSSTFDDLAVALDYFIEKREDKRKKLKLIKTTHTVEITEYTPKDVDVPALVY